MDKTRITDLYAKGYQDPFKESESLRKGVDQDIQELQEWMDDAYMDDSVEESRLCSRLAFPTCVTDFAEPRDATGRDRTEITYTMG